MIVDYTKRKSYNGVPMRVCPSCGKLGLRVGVGFMYTHKEKIGKLFGFPLHEPIAYCKRKADK